MSGLADREAGVMWREALTEGDQLWIGPCGWSTGDSGGTKREWSIHVLCTKLVASHGIVERGPLARGCLSQDSYITAYESSTP